MEANERLDALIQKHLDGLLNTDEFAELDARVSLSTEAAERLAEMSRLDILLKRHFHPTGIAREAPNVSTRNGNGAGKSRATSGLQLGVYRPMKSSGLQRGLALAACLMGMALVLYLLYFNDGKPQGISLENDTLVGLLRSADRSRSEGVRPVRSGERIVTGSHAEAFTFSGENTILQLQPETGLRIEDRRGGKYIFLEKGEVICSVAPQPAGRPMVLETVHGRSVVQGTVFRLLKNAEHTRLTVLCGKVRFSDQGQTSSALVEPGWFAQVGQAGGFEHGRLAPTALQNLKVGTFEDWFNRLHQQTSKPTRQIEESQIRRKTRPLLPEAFRLEDYRGFDLETVLGGSLAAYKGALLEMKHLADCDSATGVHWSARDLSAWRLHISLERPSGEIVHVWDDVYELSLADQPGRFRISAPNWREEMEIASLEKQPLEAQLAAVLTARLTAETVPIEPDQVYKYRILITAVDKAVNP